MFFSTRTCVCVCVCVCVCCTEAKVSETTSDNSLTKAKRKFQQQLITVSLVHEKIEFMMSGKDSKDYRWSQSRTVYKRARTVNLNKKGFELLRFKLDSEVSGIVPPTETLMPAFESR